jgi:hypothetical protein
MKKLKLLKPWQLPTVRLKLDVGAAPSYRGNEITAAAPCSDDAALLRNGYASEGRHELLQSCNNPCETVRKHRAPARRVIFASTASPHPGCPHLFS